MNTSTTILSKITGVQVRNFLVIKGRLIAVILTTDLLLKPGLSRKWIQGDM